MKEGSSWLRFDSPNDLQFSKLEDIAETYQQPIWLLSPDLFEEIVNRFQTHQRFVTNARGTLLWSAPTCNNPTHNQFGRNIMLLKSARVDTPLTIEFVDWPEDWGLISSI